MRGKACFPIILVFSWLHVQVFSHQLIGRSVENLGSKGIYLLFMLFSEGYLFSVEPQALQNGEG